jgi:hypothetical protein
MILGEKLPLNIKSEPQYIVVLDLRSVEWEGTLKGFSLSIPFILLWLDGCTPVHLTSTSNLWL